MGSEWVYKYNNWSIIVKNGKAVELYVDGQLQDRKTGIRLSADLHGCLPTGEEIKASIGGLVDVECSLFVNNALQTPVEVR